MSTIPRKGQEVAELLEKQRFIDKRRKDVDSAWGIYIQEVYSRLEQGDSELYSHGFDDLAKETDAFVKREAQWWAKSCRKYRIYEDEFESYFRFVVCRAALRYDGEKGTFFDYLRGAIRNAGRDLVREALTKKNRINHLALSLEDETVTRKVEQKYHAPSAEEEALNRIIIEQMAQDDSLTDQERQLFEFLREYPDATLQEMADEIGVGSRMQASRIKDRLAKKLQKYLED